MKKRLILCMLGCLICVFLLSGCDGMVVLDKGDDRLSVFMWEASPAETERQEGAWEHFYRFFEEKTDALADLFHIGAGWEEDMDGVN